MAESLPTYTDVLTPEQRKLNMTRIRSANTKPELFIRRALHASGFRYRLNVRSLPGRPDLVLRKYRAVIFVNGCFWHGHHCPLFKWPKANREFWEKKITRNQSRDYVTRDELRALGWRVLTIWECTNRGRDKIPAGEVIDRISFWLNSQSVEAEISGTFASTAQPEPK